MDKEQENKIEVVKSSFQKMFDVISANCEPSREKSLTITKLEEAQMWALKGMEGK